MMLELNEQVVPKKDPDKILRAMLGGYIFGPLWAIEVTLDGLGRISQQLKRCTILNNNGKQIMNCKYTHSKEITSSEKTRIATGS